MKIIRYALLLVLCLFLIAGLISIQQSSRTEAMVMPDPTPTPARFYGSAESMPAEVRYSILFQQLSELKTTDVRNESLGTPTSFRNSFYENRLGLASSKWATLDGIVADCSAQIQPLNQRASELITQYRSQFPNGELKKPQPGIQPEGKFPKTYEPLPPPPAELSQLQAQKNQIILNAKERIRLALGEADFAKFDTAVNESTARILVPINARPVQPRKVPTPNPGN
jgi:hypothetical protein